MCSSTSRAPFFAMWTVTSAWTSEYDFADAAPVRTSPAASAARTTPLRARNLTRRCRRRREAHLGRLAVARVLDLEELALREPERSGQEHRREDLDRVVEREHGVVVDLARDRDLVLGVPQLVLQVEEVLVRLELRVRLGDREQPAERLAEDALGRTRCGRPLRRGRGG